MNEKITAPWTRRQVATLNEFQQSNLMHPFTCGRRDEHPHNEGVLIATPSGWRCPAYGCRYVQDWAHAFMADGQALARMRATSPFRRGPERGAACSGEPASGLNSECSPEQEIAELREELAASQRKLGAAKAEVAQTRQQLRSAEDELGRLRPENQVLREKAARADAVRGLDRPMVAAAAVGAVEAALAREGEYLRLAHRELVVAAVLAVVDGLAWAA